MFETTTIEIMKLKERLVKSYIFFSLSLIEIKNAKIWNYSHNATEKKTM